MEKVRSIKYRKTITVRRWEIGENGPDAITVTFNRAKRVTTMRKNGVTQWRVSGVRAEGYFNKYGLLM